MKFLNKKITAVILSICFICVIILILVIYPNKDKKDTKKYIAISSTFDYVVPGNTTVIIYDEQFNVLKNESIDLGCGGPGVIENEDMIYFFAGRSYIAFNKKTGEHREYSNIIDKGVIETANDMGQCPVFIKNIGFISPTEYDCEICIIDNLDNPSISSFKTNNSYACEVIKFNNMFYVVTKGAEKESSMAMEIYDEEYNFVSKKPILSSSSQFQFYVNNDVLYLFNFLGDVTSVYKVNEDGTLKKVMVDGFYGYTYINHLNKKIYCVSSNGKIFEINLEGEPAKEIVDINQMQDDHSIPLDYTSKLLFYNDTFAIRSVIRLPAELADGVKSTIKIYLPNEGNYIESNTLTKTDLINSQKGKSLIYFAPLEDEYIPSENNSVYSDVLKNN